MNVKSFMMLFLALMSFNAWAEETLESEIKQNVMVPCFAEVVKEQLLSGEMGKVYGITYEELKPVIDKVTAVEIEKNYPKMHRSVMPMLEVAESFEERKVIYKMVARKCIEGAVGALKNNSRGIGIGSYSNRGYGRDYKSETEDILKEYERQVDELLRKWRQ